MRDNRHMRAATLAGLLVAGATAMSLAGGAGAKVGSGHRAVGRRIFFFSNRAPDLNPELFSIGRDGEARRQLTRPTDWLDAAVLSPDGTRVVGKAPDGLQIRDADGKHPRRLSTDLTANGPVWSPDSSAIAFVGTDGVYVVPAAQGQPRRLDTILHNVRPAWSPDGSEVAYAVANAQGGGDVRVARVDGSSIRTVATAPPTSAFPLDTVQWAPGERIVYASRDAIYSVDPVGGPATQLTDTRATDPLVSPDGRRIAFEDRRDGPLEPWVMNADGSRQTRLSNGLYAPEAWAPDGRELAVLPFGSTPAGASVQEQILLLATDGSGKVTPLTQEAAGSVFHSVSWTPDGARLVFTAQKAYGNDSELYSIRGDGTGLRQLTHDFVDEVNPALSPDGRRLVFDRVSGGTTRLYLMRPAGGSPREVAGAGRDAGQAAWSPDGRRLAFVRNRGGRFSLMVLDLRTHHGRRIAAGNEPSWSSDGKWIAFVSGIGVAAVHPNGRGLHRIPGFSQFPTWAPRGRRLAGESGPGGGHGWLGVETPAGRAPRRIASIPIFARPAWRPDGRALVFTDGGSLYTVPADGSARPKLIDRAAGVTDGLSW
jgi:Tol biopolymer transport system component